MMFFYALTPALPNGGGGKACPAHETANWNGEERK